MTFLYYTVISLFVFVCLILILLVLIQKGRGGGLASAFGGGGGNTAFGSKTGDVLTWATSVVFGVFLLLAIALNLLANKRHELNQLSAAAVTRAAPAPAPLQTPVQAPLSPLETPATAPAETSPTPLTAPLQEDLPRSTRPPASLG